MLVYYLTWYAIKSIRLLSIKITNHTEYCKQNNNAI